MKLLVYHNSLGLGGSQLNAVELAERMQQRGHDVVVFGPPGPLVDRVLESGMAFEPAPSRPRVRPSPAVVAALRAVVVRHGIEVVHGYEWPPILEAVWGPGLRDGARVVGTVMSMGVAPFIPAAVPLVVGTPQIAEAERRHRDVVHCIEPPVDLEANAPGWYGTDPRPGLGIAREDLLVVVVSRLARELKLEGILGATRAVAELVRDGVGCHLVVVGDGPAREEVEAAARVACASAGRPVVTVVGSLSDPRPWYAAADVALGMGSSALRAMAFAKPLVVQGELGFWQLLTPESVETFRHQGWYGIGGDGVPQLSAILRELASGPARRSELGAFSRSVVAAGFGLERAADAQERIYRTVLQQPAPFRRQARRLVRPAGQVAAYEVRRRYSRLRGQGAEDDFNAIEAQTPMRTST